MNERREVEDAAFVRCVQLATQYRLPIKLHVGYLAGTRNPRASNLAGHIDAFTSLAQRYPDCRFVLMHMGWPDQEAAIAVAKHMPNVVVDLCWSWIVSPVSTTEFVSRFLKAAPASKLMCFGGDYVAVEPIVGHAEMARRGLALSLEKLINDEWLTHAEALELVPRLMHGNAASIFGYEGAREPVAA